ncbi:glycoside hydrolase domain-containing protein [Brevibacillus migulae]|uniref:glycoside hydrolase domain-containing protein n=1 Tax=Brevibacillus migulae TaxID=1644114 RepID=UPI00106E9F4D|nr:glycoside hydrolase domain-containing protein [Brevibacillus migulae]
MATVWGVDSAAHVTADLYQCVLRNFGKPRVWGRYLTTVPNASEGLTPAEINFIHRQGIKILPIYNQFRAAVGFQRGQIVARNAVFHARRLRAPKGITLFANVERFFDIDEAWIRGWVDAMYPSGYRPGIYCDPVRGDFRNAYCQAVAKDRRVAQQAVLWSAEPEPGVTREENAPAFQPVKPPCAATVYGWQYGRDSRSCPIDTNLFDQRLLASLW